MLWIDARLRATLRLDSICRWKLASMYRRPGQDAVADGTLFVPDTLFYRLKCSPAVGVLVECTPCSQTRLDFATVGVCQRIEWKRCVVGRLHGLYGNHIRAAASLYNAIDAPSFSMIAIASLLHLEHTQLTPTYPPPRQWRPLRRATAPSTIPA
jgi:hypothetical protein